MAFRYDVAPESDLCYIELSGSVDGDDLIRAARQVYADPRVKPSMNVLWDTTPVVSLVLDVDDFHHFREAVIEVRGANVGGKGAIVVDRDAARSAAEYFRVTLRSRSREIQVFFSLSRAMEWLGVSALPGAAKAPR